MTSLVTKHPDFCQAIVHGERVTMWQCRRKPWKDGFCKQHHPDSVAKRKANSMARYRAESAERNAAWEKGQAAEKVVEAAVDFVDAMLATDFDLLHLQLQLADDKEAALMEAVSAYKAKLNPKQKESTT